MTISRQTGAPRSLPQPHILADLARERLGLKALAQWEQGIDGGDGAEALRALAAEAEGQQLVLM